MRGVRLQLTVLCLLYTSCISAFGQSESVLGGVVVPTPVYEAALPFVNSGGLRVRDFPSVDGGTILGMLDEGTRLNIEAVTGWTDSIDGGAFPWYRVQSRSSPRLSGWVFGKYVSFQPKYPEQFWDPSVVSRGHMNRVLLVRQLSSAFFGSFTIKISDSLLNRATLMKETPYNADHPSDSTFRTYRTSYGDFVISYRKDQNEHLVILIEVNRRVPGLLLNVGDTTQALDAALGSDHTLRDGELTYPVSQSLDAYAVSVSTKAGKITTISATALLN
ncbi:MAG TPA: SH3 domain-containing protein [Spirochaetia bacterium]|nr:SH3 domain-containing protein [Spirochaetia bacterium]